LIFEAISDIIQHNSLNIIKKSNNKMKYPRVIACVFTGGLMLTCLATPASAISVGIVGSVDNFLASTALSSNGKGQEEAWVSGVLGFVTTIVYKDDVTADAGWEPVNGSEDHWAHSLDTDPAHYLLKLGVGKSGADTHYLYQNLASLSWAVIDLSEMLSGQNVDFNFGRISHISEFDGSISLAEAGSFGLLLIGFSLLSLRWLSFRGRAN
jgi:hypothetical protein